MPVINEQARLGEPDFEEPVLTLQEAVYARVVGLRLGFEVVGSPDDHTYLWHNGVDYFVRVLRPRRYAVYEMGGDSLICTLDLDSFKASAYCRWLARVSW